MIEATTALGVADIQKIMACIPHRYPFLLVDRVVEINGDESGIGIKNVTVNEPQFTGHFPEQAGLSGRADDRGDGADGRCARRQCARRR